MMTPLLRLLSVRIFVLALLPSLSWGVVEGHKYPFDNERDIARFQTLAEELRCPKCQNQNLADSNAPVASDMRDKVYELMQDGKSDQEVVDYMVARYGDFVRYRPPVRTSTFLLWFGPLIILIIGALVLVAIRRSSSSRTLDPLSAEEQERLKALRNESSEGNKS